MVLLSISFENMHQILRNLYDTMTKLCHPMMDMAMALAALGALFYIAYRVWQSLSRAEPIDVFSMLRPFVLGMCILFFDVMVLGTLNGIFSPIVQGTGMLLRDQTFDLQKYQQEKDKLRADMMAKTMMTGRVFASNEELDAELDNMGRSEEEHTALQTMYEVSYAFSLQGIVQMVMRKLLEILFQSASLVIDTIRTFFLIVLSILGPIAFALSVFDGLQNTLVQWLARYISVYLWLPVADLFGAMLAKIQTLILQEEMNLMADPMSVIDVDGSSAIYLIFMVIGIIGYFCVPTVSNWIVQAGGMSAYNRNVNNTTSKVTNVAGAAAGASTGNVGAVLLKK